MAGPVTIFTGQQANLGLGGTCRITEDVGYEEPETASWGQVDLQKAAEDPEYIRDLKDALEECGLGYWAIGTHLPDQCTDGTRDSRLNGFAPVELARKPDEIEVWGIQQLKYVAMATKAMGVGVVTGFMGSPTWKIWHSFSQTAEEMAEAGLQQIERLWIPTFDVFDKCGVEFALKVHLAEVAFDYYNTRKLLEVFEYREILNINFDPNHLIWQGMDPAMSLYDFTDRVYHVRIKDAAINLNGRSGILGLHITFGDPRQGWSFILPGHGGVGSDKIVRILNVRGYDGPLSVEWEDNDVDRIFGGTEVCASVEKISFSPSAIVFDDALKTK